ncbi:DegT/DnrJ/EryC1/StrS aminotransferase family protein [Acidimicrobiia bacterium]|nr:DegT/DnrJ/EryC1/StrS aminotransferase family protein [Acidimicrobiia bacterium]
MTNIKTKKGSKFIPVFEPYITFQDKIKVFKAINSKNISGTSPIIETFENKLSNFFKSEKAVTVSNGSVALDLAFELLNLEPNDEVILPSFTIISCLSAVVRSGAKPSFCDVDPNTWNMTLENVKKAYNKNTKVILVVHTYGLPAEVDKIKKFADDKGLILIEDTAEAHGQLINNKLCGTFGAMSTLSFYANKHITTGEGGALLINDEQYIEKAMKMKNLDFDPKKRFQHDNLYWNYRLGGLQAALGISQTDNLEKTISKKIKQAEIYNGIFDSSEYIQIPQKKSYGSLNHYWVYGIILKKHSRDDLQAFLIDKGIQTRRFFWPLHLQNALPQKIKKNTYQLPVSEHLGTNGLYLPMGSHLKRKDQEFIGNMIDEFFSSLS